MKSSNYYKKMRDRYLPERFGRILKIVFILESPPIRGTYFYNDTGNANEALFRAMMSVTNFNYSTKKEGLQKFAKRGYFIVDATYKAVNNLNRRERNKIILNNYSNLVKDLKVIVKNRKVRIILVKSNICRLLEDKLLSDDFNIVNNGTVIPFPSHGWQLIFAERIRELL